MRRRAFFIAGSACLAGLSACDRAPPVASDGALDAPAPERVTEVVTDPDRTEPVVLRAGQTVAVAFTSNFDWTLAQTSEQIELLGVQTAATEAAQRDDGATGGARWFVFHFAARTPGEGVLILTEAPGWEPERVLRTARLTVRVEPETGA